VALVGAAFLAASVLPLSTAYSVSEAFGQDCAIDDTPREAPLFYATFVGVVLIAVALVLLPGAPLIPILFLSQALNAVLLLVILPFLRSLGRDREVMGDYALGRWGSVTTAVVIGLIGASVLALLVLTVA
jgi:Mn2+/Fe2+ NRAMP family transporter